MTKNIARSFDKQGVSYSDLAAAQSNGWFIFIN